MARPPKKISAAKGGHKNFLRHPQGAHTPLAPKPVPTYDHEEQSHVQINKLKNPNVDPRAKEKANPDTHEVEKIPLEN